MTQLEEFRSQLAEGEDAAAREHARRRLRAAQADPDPGRRPHRSRLRVVLAGATALAAGLAAVLIGVGGGDEPTRLGPAPASARSVLVHAAEAAADLRDGGIPRMVRPDEYFYLEIRGTYRDGGAAVGQPTHLNTRTYRRWQSLTRPGRIISDGLPPAGQPDGIPAGRLTLIIGNERFAADELAAFDPTPRELYRRLLDGVSPGQGSSPESEVFVQLVDALRDVPLRPELRATFLRALAEVPGLVLTGPTKDSLGRSGVGVAYVEHSRADQSHALVLGEDGALLAVRQQTAGGKLLEDAVVVHQAITTDLKPPRDQPSTP
jgi:hypothetical protein